MKVSVIVTVLNEEESIESLLFALVSQSTQAHEIIIVDGGSKDLTIEKIKIFSNNNSSPSIRSFVQVGNRSKGRNFAISQSRNDWIAITDAGCIPKKDWLKELLKKQVQTHTLVVAGFYQGKSNSIFEEAVIPYALVMTDRVDPNSFLPATRSMLVHKSVWEKLGGFDETLSDNEDYDFALRIQKENIKISFAKDAIVEWLPRKNLQEFYKMIFRFARGDVTARIFRPKVVLIFIRYATIDVLVLLGIFVNLKFFTLLIILGAFYFVWSIVKNKKYVPSGWYWLPVLQIVSDIAVMVGSIAGLRKQR